MPLWALAGFRLHHIAPWALVVAVSVLVNFALEFLLYVVGFAGVVLSAAVQSALSFVVQVVPLLLAPWLVQRAIEAGTLYPMRLHVGVVAVQLLAALVVVRFLAPVFSRSSDTVQVLIRLVAFPFVVEAMVMATRCLGARYLRPRVPKDTTMVYISQSVTIMAMVGRFLTTNMGSTALTILVSVAGALLEMTLRLTMVHRDAFYQSMCAACEGPCGRAPRPASAKRPLPADDTLVAASEGVPSSLLDDHTAAQEDPPLNGGAASLNAGQRQRTSSHSSVFLASTPAASVSAAPAGLGSGGGALVKQASPVKYDRSALMDDTTSQTPASLSLPVLDASLNAASVHDDTSLEGAGATGEKHNTVQVPPALSARLAHRDSTSANRMHGYYSFLLVDTMAEDVGILASLSLTLLFRLPARRGELPIEPSQVVLRVLIQYLLEMATDLGPALLVWCLAVCCDSRFVNAPAPQTTPAQASSSSSPALTELKIETGVDVGASSPPSARDEVILPVAPQLQDSHLAGAKPARLSHSSGACDVCALRKWPLAQAQRRSVQAARNDFVARDADISDDPIWRNEGMHRLLRQGLFGSGLEQMPEEGTAERRFCFQTLPVPAGSTDSMTISALTWRQRTVAQVLLRSELAAVRLARAWETRTPKWRLLYLLGTIHAILLVTRVMAGVDLRCPYTDGSGTWFWNFCSAAS